MAEGGGLVVAAGAACRQAAAGSVGSLPGWRPTPPPGSPRGSRLVVVLEPAGGQIRARPEALTPPKANPRPDNSSIGLDEFVFTPASSCACFRMFPIGPKSLHERDFQASRTTFPIQSPDLHRRPPIARNLVVLCFALAIGEMDCTNRKLAALAGHAENIA